MKRFFAILVFTLLLAATGKAQSGFYLSVNPLGVLEPQAAYGMGVGFAFNDQVDLSTEYAYLGKPTWTDEGRYTNIKGFRSVTTMRFTTSTNEYRGIRNFMAAELRVRKFSFDDMQDFANNTTHSIIKDYSFKNNTSVLGFAALLGRQKEIGYGGKWFVEFTAGIGIRYTTVNRENIPINFSIVPVEAGFGEMPNYKDQQTSFYFPLAVRIILKL